MKVPVLDGPQVATRPVSPGYSSLNFDTGGEALARGIGQLGQGMGQVGKVFAEVQHKADVVSANDALTQYQHDQTSALVGNDAAGGMVPGGQAPNKLAGPEGFFRRKGLDAVKDSSATLEYLQKRQAELAEKLPTASAKALFAQEARKLYESSRNQVERHVSQAIQEAQVASVEARKQAALTTIANNYGDEEVVAQQVAAVVGPMSALKLSDEDGKAKEAQWHADVTKTRLNQYLARKDWQGAEALFAKTKDALGPASTKYEEAIGGMRRDSAADGFATTAVAQARDADGRVDDAKALAAIDEAIPNDVELREEARQRAKQRLVEARQEWEAESKDISNQAFGQYNTGGWKGIDSELKKELNKRNPPLYHRLKEDNEINYRRSQKDRGSTAKERSFANRLAMQEYMQKPVEERAELNVDEEFTGSGADVIGLGALKVQQRKDKDALQKGAGLGESRFLEQAQANAAGNISKAEAKDFKADVTIEYGKFVEAHKRPPNREEANKLIADSLLTVTEKGVLWDSTTRNFKVRAKARKAGTPASTATAEATPDIPTSAPAAPPPAPQGATPDIPVEERARIEAKLKARGRSATEAEVRRLYNLANGK